MPDRRPGSPSVHTYQHVFPHKRMNKHSEPVRVYYSPMVEMKVVLKASSEKRNSTQVFPTPESPIKSSLNSRSYVFFAIWAVIKHTPTINGWRPECVFKRGRLCARVRSKNTHRSVSRQLNFVDFPTVDYFKRLLWTCVYSRSAYDWLLCVVLYRSVFPSLSLSVQNGSSARLSLSFFKLHQRSDSNKKYSASSQRSQTAQITARTSRKWIRTESPYRVRL